MSVRHSIVGLRQFSFFCSKDSIFLPWPINAEGQARRTDKAMLLIHYAYLKFPDILATIYHYFARRLSLHKLNVRLLLLCCQESFHSLLVISCHQRPETKRRRAPFNSRFKIIFVVLVARILFFSFDKFSWCRGTGPSESMCQFCWSN